MALLLTMMGEGNNRQVETKIDGDGVMCMSFIVQILITSMSSQLFVHIDEQRCAVAN